MTPKLNANDVASYFVNKGVSPLKLQKLLYYSQLWFYVKNDKHLFRDRIQAWVYGPVVYDVWLNYKFVKRNSLIPHNRANKIDFDDSTINHLNQVWDSYGHLSGSDLVDLTHKDLTWKNSRQGLDSDQSSTNIIVIDDKTTSDFNLDINNKIPFAQPLHSLGHFNNF